MIRHKELFGKQPAEAYIKSVRIAKIAICQYFDNTNE